MRILLSEGSSTASLQVARRLDQLGHEVEVLSSAWLCLARFTRHVGAVHAAPRFGRDPFLWLAAAQRIARERKIDLLFPTQEQVTVLSARRNDLGVATIVPPFAGLARVQDRISAFRTLAALGAPQPPSFVVAHADDLAGVTTFPAFVKQPVSTASSGVKRVENARELAEAARKFGMGRSDLGRTDLGRSDLGRSDLGRTELIVQAEALGPLAMVQAVAQRGRLVAHHACLRLREGVAGGAAVKESVVLPGLGDLLGRLAAALDWHGGLSMDVIVTDRGLLIIDVNPRLVEPANALAAGVDLVAAMIDAAGEAPAPPREAGRPGARTRQAIVGVLGAAARDKTRRAILRETAAALFSRGAYAGSVEELTPVSDDPLTAVPLIAAIAGALLHPPLWRNFHASGVGAYAVGPQAWARILAGRPD